jgi:glycosyltransferase involved in cell wall biosynthesis
LRVVISNFSPPVNKDENFLSYWRQHVIPPRRPRRRLFEAPHDWGFHIYAPGVYLMDRGVAEHVEFWDYSSERSTSYHSNGVLRVVFNNAKDVQAYLEVYGYPDLFINHGRHGQTILQLLEGKCFRVHVPALRHGLDRMGNENAECYLVDSEEFLDRRSMLYVPVVNTDKVSPASCEKERDFVYLAQNRPEKRHDILLNAVRGTGLTGHFHPVDRSKLNLNGTYITTSDFNELDVVQLLRSSRIAVYSAHIDSNAASMWECVAAGLPIVVNKRILGGRHVVVPGVTGELAGERNFRDVMTKVLRNRDSYRPREYFEKHWDTITLLHSYFSFFVRMGWGYRETVEKLQASASS